MERPDVQICDLNQLLSVTCVTSAGLSLWPWSGD